jgi:hypothetical protein
LTVDRSIKTLMEQLAIPAILVVSFGVAFAGARAALALILHLITSRNYPRAAPVISR